MGDWGEGVGGGGVAKTTSRERYRRVSQREAREGESERHGRVSQREAREGESERGTGG